MSTANVKPRSHRHTIATIVPLPATIQSKLYNCRRERRL